MRCHHCIRGFVMRDFDELKCINCGRPAYQIEPLPLVNEQKWAYKRRGYKHDWDNELAKIKEGVMV